VALDAIAFLPADRGSLAEVTKFIRALPESGLNSAVMAKAEASAIRIAVAVIAELSERAKTTETTSPKTSKAPKIKKNRVVMAVR